MASPDAPVPAQPDEGKANGLLPERSREVESKPLDLDLDLCAKEPIHVPGAIQSQGWLLAVDGDVCVDAISDNVPDLLGLRPVEILGADLTRLVGQAAYDLLAESRLRNGLPTQPMRLTIADRSCDVVAHVGPDRRSIFEIEPVAASDDSPTDLLTRVEAVSDRVFAEDGFDRASNRLAEGVRRLTGFERVVIYRFDESWSGEVVAEDAGHELERYLGLRFPASDIPPQARRLYELAPVRVIFDAQSDPARLIGREEHHVSLDLSRSILRAVSPVHIRYMANMGVRASMSISLMHEGRLWGLVSCQDRIPMHPSSVVRRSAALIGRLTMPRIAELDPRQGRRRRARSSGHLEHLIQALAVDRDPLRLLADPTHGAMPLIASDGLIVRIGGRTRTAGFVPGSTEVDRLLDHLDGSLKTGLWAEHHLAGVWPEAATMVDSAAGVMAIRIGRTRGDLLVWLRAEQPQVVKWAGDPRKPAAWDEDGVSRLQPRESFAAWREDVRGHSEPWLGWEQELADRTRAMLVNIVDRFDAFDTEKGLRRRAEQDLERAQTDLVRQRRAVLAMLADAADTGGDRARMREFVAGLGPMVDRLASATGRRQEMVQIEGRLAELERMVSDPSDTEARDRIRALRRQVVGLLDDSASDARDPVRLVGLEAVLELLPADTPLALRRRGDDAIELMVHRALREDENERLRTLAGRDTTHAYERSDAEGRTSIVIRRRDDQ